MLSINNLDYYIGGRPIYEQANLHIKPRDKMGLIGLNGTGKTTLLKIINGELMADGGEISKSNDCTLGFLNQDLLSYQSDEPILEVAMQAFREVIKIHHKIDDIIHQLEQNYEDKLVEKLNKLQEKYELLEGYSIQSKAAEILEGIGFSTDDLNRPLREFSGGWRMRVMLAKLLLEKPSLLMLDEPTNHLDLPSIQWIEGYLKNYDGAVVIVSHDQQFLNTVCDNIAEVSGFKLNLYPGNYDFYLKEKALRNEVQQNAFENQQQQIKQTERFISRFRAKASKARQVQSRVKSLEKMEMIEEVKDENIRVNFRFNFGKKSGRHVCTIDKLGKSYDDLMIFSNAKAAIERGDKIALIGANGKGKSTLLRLIAQMESFEGKCEAGYNVISSFYAQHQLEALNVNNDILTELKQYGSGKTELELRSVLGCFLFSGDDVFKKIKVLSGGEKSRVALAKTLISEANFLLLDEPTNHLDIQSVNILIQALQQYEGSFLLVSHNRHFISQVANKIWWIEDHQLKEYPGPYEEYKWWNDRNQKSTSQVSKDSPRMSKTGTHQKNKSTDIELKKLTTRMREYEDQVEQLEGKKYNLEKELTKPEVFSNPDRLFEVNQQFEKVKEEIRELTGKWEKVIEEIEAIETSSVS